MKKLAFLIILWLTVSCKGDERGFDASGTFEAREVLISAEVSGQIRALAVEEGVPLSKGAAVGWIDSLQLHLRKKQLQAQRDAILARRPDVATQLATYEVQLETAQRDLQRIQNLRSAKAATEKQLDDARAKVAGLQRQMEAHRSSLDVSTRGLVSETLPLMAQIEQINDQLRKTRIVNPVEGTVLARYAEPFELASPGVPLYKIADLSTLELRAYITGAQLAEVRLGQEVAVFVDTGKGDFRKYEGRVSWISDKAEFTPKSVQTKDERANLVYAIKVTLENDGYLKIGMYGEVDF